MSFRFYQDSHDCTDVSDILPSPCSTSVTNTPISTSSKVSSYSSSVDQGRFYERRSTCSVHIHELPSRISLLDRQYIAKLPRSQISVEHDYAEHGIIAPPGIIRQGNEILTTPNIVDTSVSSYHSFCASIDDSPQKNSYENDSPTFPPESLFTPKRKDSSFHSTGSSTPNLTTCSSKALRYYTPTFSPISKLKGSYYNCDDDLLCSESRSGNSFGISSSRDSSHFKSVSSVENRYSDRFIPSRVTSNLSFSVWADHSELRCDQNKKSTDSSAIINSPHVTRNTIMQTPNDGDLDSSNGDANPGSIRNTYAQNPCLLNSLLRCELLGENEDPLPYASNNGQWATSHPTKGNSNNESKISPTSRDGKYLRYSQSPRQPLLEDDFGSALDKSISIVKAFSLSPVGISSSRRLLSVPPKRKRKISRLPFKVLDAPALADDYYLNLVDWSSQNVLAVGLGSCVYLWSAFTSKVVKLLDLGPNRDDSVTSVAWTQHGTHLSVGCNNGEIQIWDTVKGKMVRSMGGHSARVGALCWSGPVLASGSRDRLIYLRDARNPQPYISRLASHKQEVCGLKWSFDDPVHLASGGNDNKLLVWDINNHKLPAHRFADHTAAVKAIAWSPHQRGVLASGGGTADRCIRFWNALSGSVLHSIDTGSQVCNLSWSRNCNEIVSTHGYSLNQIVVWKYPTMQKVVTLTGHTSRVLYLSMSPDGSTIVTGAGDETLRFWQVFPEKNRSDCKSNSNGFLFPSTPGSVIR